MIEKEIKENVKKNNVIFGYKEVIKALKCSKLEKVIIASNAPERVKKDVEYNSRISGTKVEIFDKTNKDLGILCGKPFSVSVLGIKR